MAELILTQDNFEKEVLQSSLPVLVDFWATWCGPCKMIAPVVASIAEDFAGKIVVGKVNVDEAPELAAAFAVSSIPTLMLFEGGEVKKTVIGYRTREDLEALLF